MKDSVLSLFPEKERGVAIFGSLMHEKEGMGATWSWASSSRDGGGSGWYWGEGGRGKLQGEGWGIGAGGGRREVLVGLHESHVLCQMDDLLSEISYVHH